MSHALDIVWIYFLYLRTNHVVKMRTIVARKRRNVAASPPTSCTRSCLNVEDIARTKSRQEIDLVTGRTG